MLKKVYLEISNICNLSCAFCPGTLRDKRMLSVQEFTALAGKLRGHTDYLYFHLMGEPLLHPCLRDFLCIAGDMGFKVIITTNGTLLGKSGDILLSSPAVHKINISLQSFEANSSSDLAGYIRDCAEFARSAAEKGKICVMRLWNENGLDRLNDKIRSLLEQSFPAPWKQSRQSLSLAKGVFLEPGERFDWPDLSLSELGEQCFCYGLRDQIGVLCDGTVVPCCLDKNGDMALGNLFESELEDILSFPRAKAIYDGFSGRKAAEKLCRTCGYARRFG